MTTRAVKPTEDVEESRNFELESSRVRRTLDLTFAYKELVLISTKLPHGAGVPAVVRALLDGVSALVPYRAVGACVSLPGHAEPIVDYRLPPLVLPPGRDPTRLFPELSHELVLDLRGLRDSTFHAATITGAFDDDTEEAVFMAHVADVLAAGVTTALALRTARPVSAELADLRAQVIQAEKLSSLGQLVAGVVHELANPVTSIVACTDILLHKRNNAERPLDEVQHLQRIGAAAERILKFSRDLVAYARPATDVPGPVVIPEVVAQAQGFCEHEFAKNNVIFSVDFSNGCPPILGQSGPLIQVFVNLFTNASHAMSEHGGKLVVSAATREEESVLEVSVMDTGIGIPAEAIGKIFDPFYTTKEKGHGSGLGLSIVREILGAHSGKIDAKSTVGEGTTFTVALPLYGR